MKCMSSQGPDPIASHRVRVHRDDCGSAFGIRSTYLPVFDLNMGHSNGPRFVPFPEIHVPLSSSYECTLRRTSGSPPVWDSGKIDDSRSWKRICRNERMGRYINGMRFMRRTNTCKMRCYCHRKVLNLIKSSELIDIIKNQIKQMSFFYIIRKRIMRCINLTVDTFVILNNIILYNQRSTFCSLRDVVNVTENSARRLLWCST